MFRKHLVFMIIKLSKRFYFFMPFSLSCLAIIINDISIESLKSSSCENHFKIGHCITIERLLQNSTCYKSRPRAPFHQNQRLKRQPSIHVQLQHGQLHNARSLISGNRGYVSNRSVPYRKVSPIVSSLTTALGNASSNAVL